MMHCSRCGKECEGIEVTPGATSAICDGCNGTAGGGRRQPTEFKAALPAAKPRARKPKGVKLPK